MCFNHVNSTADLEDSSFYTSVNDVKSIKLLYTNCDCFTQTKVSEIECHIQSFSPDIITLTEIFPKNKVFDTTMEQYTLQGFTSYISNQNKGRGCIIYLKNSLIASEVSFDTSFEESVWCKVKLKNRDNLILGCTYRSPNSSAENVSKLNTLLRDISDMNPSHLLIMGDFNFKEINWKNNMSTVNENHIA